MSSCRSFYDLTQIMKKHILYIRSSSIYSWILINKALKVAGKMGHFDGIVQRINRKSYYLSSIGQKVSFFMILLQWFYHFYLDLFYKCYWMSFQAFNRLNSS